MRLVVRARNDVRGLVRVSISTSPSDVPTHTVPAPSSANAFTAALR